MNGPLETKIERLLHERTGRSCLFVPSGRIGLYLAFREWLRPGDRILMSPVNDDVIFFMVLAAGLRPVLAPVSPQDGNIDPGGVPDHTWSSVAAVLTTNLYGLPDRVVELGERCSELGIPLIEDAAHAIETEVDGRPIGTFGAVSAFSLSKHLGGVGGVVSFSDERRADGLRRLRHEAVGTRRTGQRIDGLLRPAARAVLQRSAIARSLQKAGRAAGVLPPLERAEFRMPLRPAELAVAVAGPPSLQAFERWLRVDRSDYRVGQSRALLRRTIEKLESLDDDRRRRVEGVKIMRATQSLAVGATTGPPLALLRVPLIVENRAAVNSILHEKGIEARYIYDPPLDDYAGPSFAEPVPDPESTRWWASHVLPVDPLDVDRIVAALGDAPTMSL